MENIIKKLREIEENFASTTQAFAPFPTPVVDATKIEIQTKPEKDKEVVKEKELEQ